MCLKSLKKNILIATMPFLTLASNNGQNGFILNNKAYSPHKVFSSFSESFDDVMHCR